MSRFTHTGITNPFQNRFGSNFDIVQMTLMGIQFRGLSSKRLRIWTPPKPPTCWLTKFHPLQGDLKEISLRGTPCFMGDTFTTIEWMQSYAQTTEHVWHLANMPFEVGIAPFLFCLVFGRANNKHLCLGWLPTSLQWSPSHVTPLDGHHFDPSAPQNPKLL